MLTGFCERCIFKVVTQKENFSIGDVYKGNTSVAVSMTVTGWPLISPQNTNSFTFNNGLLYGKCQTRIFPEEYLKKDDNLFASPDERSARKVKGGMLIEVFIKQGKVAIVECGKNDFSDSPVYTGGINRNSFSVVYLFIRKD